MDDTTLALAVGAIFLLAGFVKGVIGFGLPLVSLGLLTAVLDITSAILLLIVPAFVTNVWQAAVGGNGWQLWRRLWLFFVFAALMIWFGTYALSYSRVSALVLGGIFIIYAFSSRSGMRYRVSARREKTAGALIGAVNGVFTGMTGNFAFPGLLFLQGIGLSRDELVQAMGILFTVSTVFLTLSLHARGLLTSQAGIDSALAVLPALVGMFCGQRLRRHLSDTHFRQAFYAGVAMMGFYIVVKNLV